MRGVLSLVLLGYMIGFFCYQQNPAVADFNMYDAIPFAISLDNMYMVLQKLKLLQTAAQALSDVKNAVQLYAEVYAELLPTLGYDFLSQFDERELLAFYSQCINNNIEFSLEQFLINADATYLASLSALP